MIQDFKPVTKREPGILGVVSQFGWLDLVEANNKGVVSGDLESAESKMNGISDPSSIMGKPSDIFEAYRMHDYIKNSSKSASKKGAKSETSQISPEGPNAGE